MKLWSRMSRILEEMSSLYSEFSLPAKLFIWISRAVSISICGDVREGNSEVSASFYWEKREKYFSLSLLGVLITHPLLNAVHIPLAWLQCHQWQGIRLGCVINTVTSILRWYLHFALIDANGSEGERGLLYMAFQAAEKNSTLLPYGNAIASVTWIQPLNSDL